MVVSSFKPSSDTRLDHVEAKNLSKNVFSMYIEKQWYKLTLKAVSSSPLSHHYQLKPRWPFRTSSPRTSLTSLTFPSSPILSSSPSSLLAVSLVIEILCGDALSSFYSECKYQFNAIDLRTDSRIDFVGGIRGYPELEKHVDSGNMAVAFGVFPVDINDLMAISYVGLSFYFICMFPLLTPQWSWSSYAPQVHLVRA